MCCSPPAEAGAGRAAGRQTCVPPPSWAPCSPRHPAVLGDTRVLTPKTKRWQGDASAYAEIGCWVLTPPYAATDISALTGDKLLRTFFRTVLLYELTIQSGNQGHSVPYPRWKLEDTARFVVCWVFFFLRGAETPLLANFCSGFDSLRARHLTEMH